MEELLERHKQETAALRAESEQLGAQMQQRMKAVGDEKAKLELQLRMATDERKLEMSQIAEKLKETERARKEAEDRARALDTQKVRLLEENDERHRERQQAMEQAAEERDLRATEELERAQSSYEQTLAQLKALHAQEKETLEARVQEQKRRNK